MARAQTLPTTTTHVLRRRGPATATRKRPTTKTHDSTQHRRYQSVLEQYPVLSAEQERELFATLAQGDEEAREEARNTLILSNVGLVAKNAAALAYGIPIEELIQVGFIGLMRAVEKFEVERGFRFSTYATWWIRQSMLRAKPDLINMVHVPSWVGDRDRKLAAAADKHRAIHGREATLDELAEAVGITAEQVMQSQQAVKISSVWSSLDQSLDEDSEVPRSAESLPDPLAETAIKRVEAANDAAQMLSELGERDAQILRERHGIGRADGDAQTLKQVGQQLGVSHTRVGQLEQRALRVLRRALRAERGNTAGWIEQDAWSPKR